MLEYILVLKNRMDFRYGSLNTSYSWWKRSEEEEANPETSMFCIFPAKIYPQNICGTKCFCSHIRVPLEYQSH